MVGGVPLDTQVCFGVIVTASTREELEKATDLMCHYCKKWRLSTNSSNTKVMIFGHHKADVRNRTKFQTFGCYL